MMEEGGCLGGGVSEQQNLDFTKLIFSWSIDDHNKSDEKRIHFDGREMVSAIWSYWQCQLLSVGIKCQNLTNPYKKRLQYFLGISLSYLDIVFPLDWRKSVDEDLVSIRETDLSVNLLEEIILQTVDIKALEREIRDRGLKDVSVARALQHALDSSFGATSSFLSLYNFRYLLDRLLLMHSFSSQKSYTTRSSFVELFTYIQSALTLSAGQSSLTLSVMIERIEDILSCSEFGIGMIQRSKIDDSYYPILVLKMVMILSLICLKLPKYSHRLLQHLSGYDNYAYFLPKKFVSCLLRKSKNQELNLNLEVVAEAFSSVDDPLLIISSEDGSPKINALCAIFVDLRKSKEEIMSVLFPRKNTHNIPTSLNTVNGGAIPEGSSSETLPDMNMNCVVMNWKVIEEISEAINEKKGIVLNKLPAATRIMNEFDISRATFLLAVAARSSCSAMEFQNFERFVFLVNEGLKMLSFAFDTSVPEHYYALLLNSSTVKIFRIVENNSARFIKEAQVVADNRSIIWKNLRVAVDFLQGVRHAIDKYYNYLNDYVLNQVIKVKETCDEASVVLENRSECDNTQNGNNEKGKGSNKEKKSKKNK
ncbi:hypothetical protein Tco_0369300, partial [Tanacetum coccineum]